jgi:hypothetical protein
MVIANAESIVNILACFPPDFSTLLEELISPGIANKAKFLGNVERK